MEIVVGKAECWAAAGGAGAVVRGGTVHDDHRECGQICEDNPPPRYFKHRGFRVTSGDLDRYWRHKLMRHACCWLWKLAILIPLLHLALHFFGIPHSEMLNFIP